MQIPVCSVHAQTLWVCISVNPVKCWEETVFGAFLPTSSYSLFASSSIPFPDPWGEEFDGDISFRAEYSKVSHSLHYVWLWVAVFVPICCRRKIACWWLSKAPMYVFSRIPLGVISLLCFFSRTVTSGFSPGPWSQVLGHQSSIGCRFHLMVWTLNSISYWLFTPTAFHYQYTRVSCRQVSTVDQRVCTWVGVYLSPLVVCRVTFSNMDISQ